MSEEKNPSPKRREPSIVQRIVNARDLRDLAGRLRNILHDQNLGDVANVGCFECGGELERRLGDRGFEDHWTSPATPTCC